MLLVARDGAVLADAVRDIEAKGGAASWFAADVGEIAEVRAAAAAAVERFGRIDTWVNNAGVALYAALVDTPLDEHRQLFRTNYFGAVHGALIAVQHLQEKGGALITVGSIAGDMPSPVMGAYAASKHAVKGFIESLQDGAERRPRADLGHADQAVGHRHADRRARGQPCRRRGADPAARLRSRSRRERDPRRGAAPAAECDGRRRLVASRC